MINTTFPGQYCAFAGMTAFGMDQLSRSKSNGTGIDNEPVIEFAHQMRRGLCQFLCPSLLREPIPNATVLLRVGQNVDVGFDADGVQSSLVKSISLPVHTSNRIQH